MTENMNKNGIFFLAFGIAILAAAISGWFLVFKDIKEPAKIPVNNQITATSTENNSQNDFEIKMEERYKDETIIKNYNNNDIAVIAEKDNPFVSGERVVLASTYPYKETNEPPVKRCGTFYGGCAILLKDINGITVLKKFYDAGYKDTLGFEVLFIDEPKFPIEFLDKDNISLYSYKNMSKDTFYIKFNLRTKEFVSPYVQ